MNLHPGTSRAVAPGSCNPGRQAAATFGTASQESQAVIPSKTPHERKAVISNKARNLCISLSLLLPSFITPLHAQPTTGKVSGAATYALTREFLAVAPKRFNGSPGHLAAEQFIRAHFAPEDRDHRFEVDSFTASTPAGLQSMHNLIVKFPGKKDGIIVLATHYETNYPLKDINFVGANDGACTSALLIEIGQYLRAHPPTGYSVWILFDDGEEAVSADTQKAWAGNDNDYGTRHIAAKWSQDGVLSHIKAFLLADMIGDKDLDILEETQSDKHLRDLMRQAAINTHHTANVFKTQGAEEDDHLPFIKRGVPSLDVIDVTYGPYDNKTGDYAFHHTVQDTLDKLSPQSLQIAADLFLEMITLLNQH